MTIHSKARTHNVETDEAGFLVTSGSSGRRYRVVVVAGTTQCGCEWGSRRSTPCSHVEAVAAFAAQVLAPVARVPDEKFWARIEADGGH